MNSLLIVHCCSVHGPLPPGAHGISPFSELSLVGPLGLHDWDLSHSPDPGWGPDILPRSCLPLLSGFGIGIVVPYPQVGSCSKEAAYLEPHGETCPLTSAVAPCCNHLPLCPSRKLDPPGYGLMLTGTKLLVCCWPLETGPWATSTHSHYHPKACQLPVLRSSFPPQTRAAAKIPESLTPEPEWAIMDLVFEVSLEGQPGFGR